MTEILTLLGLLTLAYLSSFVLSAQQRQGYGLVSGTEFVAIGFAAGPTGLAFLSGALLESAAPAIMLAVGWLGFRLGLRFRASEVRGLSGEHRVAVLLKPLMALGLMFGLLEALDRVRPLGLTWTGQLALAAIGSVTTKSAILSLTGLHRAAGPVTRLVHSIARFDDLLPVLAVGVLFAFQAAPEAGGVATGASLLGGLAMGGVASLLLGRSLWREDFAWVALLGFTALCTGLSSQVGLSALAVTTCFGVALGWVSPHADALERMTEKTERPIVQVLLLLIGAQLELSRELAVVALVVLLARAGAMALTGASLWALRLPSARGEPLLGLGLLPSGGIATVMVLSYVQANPGRPAQLVLWAFVAFSLFGDLVGSRALRALLARRGELGGLPRDEGAVELQGAR